MVALRNLAVHTRPGFYAMRFPDEDRTVRTMLAETVTTLRSGAVDDYIEEELKGVDPGLCSACCYPATVQEDGSRHLQ